MKINSILLKTFFLSFSFLILISFFKPPLLVSGNSIYISSGIPENGISIGDPFAVCHGYASSEESAQELKDQGVSLSRNDLPWGAVERVSGVYNYKHYDHFYGNLSAQSIRGLAILDYGNSILYGEEYDRYIPSWMIPHWLRYVNETVDRYRTIVDYWEIWNEPNLDKFWSGSDVEFFDLLNSTAHLIKSISPDIKIISPGISGHNPDYLNSMIDYIGDAEFNSLFYALNYHPYSGSNAELITQKTKDVQEVAMAHGYSGEIWITEVGISTQVTSVDRVEEEYQENWDYQGEQLVKTYAQALAAGTDIVVWYCYRDSYPMNWTYGESAFGLQHFWGGGSWAGI